MSAKKKLPEITKEDLSLITQIRNKINELLNSDKDAKKAAQALKIWLEKDNRKK